MRSYLFSLAFVLCLLFGYTAIVLTSHTPLKTEPTRASTDTDHREPAAEASAANSDI